MELGVRWLHDSAYPSEHDYRSGSPHLKHWHLYQRLLGQVRLVLDSLREEGLPLSVVDIGAGQGSFVEPLLAYGCHVTAVEMSRGSVDVLQARYGTNERFSVVLDEDGSLVGIGARDFSLVLYVSVLHHIPDYEAPIEAALSRLIPGGSLIALQDPLWYPTLGRWNRTLSRGAYLAWRLQQGNYLRGVRTRLRQFREAYDESNPSDMLEYHVVRRGVDQERLRQVLAARFRHVEVIRYWSTQSSLWQRLGEAVRAENTFGIVATHLWPQT
jgi:SAM-dependent methyltransferase